MPWEKQFDKQAALDRALDAFWSRGYEATSMQDLVDCMGVNRGSLYATYGDKRALFLSALRSYDQGRQQMLAGFEARLPPREAIRQVFLAFTSDISESGNRGCFLTNTALELAAHDDQIRALDAEGRPLNTEAAAEQGFFDRGAANSDMFWLWPGTFIMDAGKEDFITMFGSPLTGGTNLPVVGVDMYSALALMAVTAKSGIAMDWKLPWIFYATTAGNQLVIYDKISGTLGIGGDLAGMTIVEDYDFGNVTDAKFNISEPGNDTMSLRMARAA